MYVTGKYKTGVYAGTPMEERRDQTLLQVEAVIKHPLQGDLHQGFATDVPLFHQRNALAHKEKAWVPTVTVKSFTDDLPSYEHSLQSAVDDEIARMKERNDSFGDEALKSLEELKVRYSK
ncbi:sporulation phosphorelay system protein KapB [Geomicrobium sp. JSM 1781026]|uniref:sporulation phosphorelay system protein KapB n=1 Tax=Geomicrobium sp. JSM 1781026 TaxID=3344580 RepID=UPI0035BFDF3E